MMVARRRVAFSKKLDKCAIGAFQHLHVEANKEACPTRAEIEERRAHVAAERHELLRSKTDLDILFALGLAAKLRAEVEEYMGEACESVSDGVTFQNSELDNAAFELREETHFGMNFHDDAYGRSACGRTDLLQMYDADDVEYFFGCSHTKAEARMNGEASCESSGMSSCSQVQSDETGSTPTKSERLQVGNFDVESDEESNTVVRDVTCETTETESSRGANRVILPPLDHAEQFRAHELTPSRPTGLRPALTRPTCPVNARQQGTGDTI
eukprot:TRINITY_DN55518_c0_g1_i1.p1 TRINITY_DN55518_c0_g1~~TRINITY_DN55518_c0_g1_i1.p1  ORF type:complete len:292 (+),score=57.12 TRINITY_DN55518_c0_g1_i1:68-877(+)